MAQVVSTCARLSGRWVDLNLVYEYSVTRLTPRIGLSKAGQAERLFKTIEEHIQHKPEIPALQLLHSSREFKQSLGVCDGRRVEFLSDLKFIYDNHPVESERRVRYL